jgi:hypothetical protein
MFDLSLKIRNAFSKFVGNNPAWTLSAGIAITPQHTPVLKAIDHAEELLEASKRIPGREIIPWPEMRKDSSSDQEVFKDRLTALGTSIPWPMFSEILEQAKVVTRWLKEGIINTGKVRRLMYYAQLERLYLSTKKTHYLEYAPLLVRDIRRNWKDLEKSPAGNPAYRWVAGLPMLEAKGMKSLLFVCSYALYANRTSSREPNE